MKDDPALLDAMNQIRDYIERNPDAADTIDGVACWLHSPPLVPTKDVIQRALDRLVECNEIDREPLPGGKAFYRRHHDPES